MTSKRLVKERVTFENIPVVVANQKRGDERLLVDELDMEKERRKLWTNHAGRGYNRTYSSNRMVHSANNKRSPSPTRGQSQRTYPFSRLPNDDLDGPVYEPSRDHVVPPRSPSPPGVRRRPTPPIQTTDLRTAGRTERTKHLQSRPKPPHQYASFDPSRTDMRCATAVPYQC